MEGQSFCKACDLLPGETIEKLNLDLEDQNCNCSARSFEDTPEYLTRLPFDVRHKDPSLPQRHFQLKVFEGDVATLDDKKFNVCSEFDLDGESCSMFAKKYSSKVLQAEVQHSTNLLLKLSPHTLRPLRALLNVIEHLKATVDYEQERYRVAANAVSSLRRDLKQEQYRHEQSKIHCPLNRHNEILHYGAATCLSPSSQNQTKIAEAVKNAPKPIPRFDMRKLKYHEYLELVNKSMPFILTHAKLLAGCPGVPPWSVAELKAACGDRSTVLKSKSDYDNSLWAFKLQLAHLSRHFWMTLPIDRMNHGPTVYQASTCMTLAWQHFVRNSSSRSWLIPKYFAVDALQRVCTKNSAYWPSLFIGNNHTTSGLHVDWGSTAAWMGLLQGQKRWRIAQPSERPFLYERVQDDLEAHPLMQHAHIYEGVLEAGEVIFIPADSPHQVVNLDMTIAVAMNFVDGGNIDAHREFVRYQLMETDNAVVSKHLQRALDSLTEISIPQDVEPISLPFTLFKQLQFNCSRLLLVSKIWKGYASRGVRSCKLSMSVESRWILRFSARHEHRL
ncbi:hypothetical protein Ae201684_001507 [Aphanomyces euteiches]|uniref:JmjC domain-containing protein n=1 Tax=Aphanomyces euteiches TaxID=100861 RepID=A0A6G0XTC4_9STRA|nr:hypothetical protein Ae201684_001507 [Aphanomyces euteiches]